MRLIIVFLCLFAGVLPTFAGTAADEWKSLVALDAGPATKPKNAEEANQIALAHMDRQEKALRDFIAAYPADEHIREAKLRLVRVLNLRASVTQSTPPPEAGKLMDELEKTATPENLVEVHFARLTQEMRLWQGKRVPKSAREKLLRSAEDFQKRFPSDRRVASVLVEIGRLFESKPDIKTKLLNDAASLNKDPNLKMEIADEFKRLACLDKPLALQLRDVNGVTLKTEEWKGKPVLLIFVSVLERSCLETMGEISSAISKLPEKPRLVLVSLDDNKDDVSAFAQRHGIKTPIAWEKEGWESRQIRELGLNLIPSVWLLDGNGIIRSLDPMDDLVSSIKALQK